MGSSAQDSAQHARLQADRLSRPQLSKGAAQCEPELSAVAKKSSMASCGCLLNKKLCTGSVHKSSLSLERAREVSRVPAYPYKGTGEEGG